MEKAIIGKKVGMTQIFDADGKVVPVTVIEAGPCSVVQKKTAEKDGYEAVQLGFMPTTDKHLTRGQKGHLAKAGVGNLKVLKEFKLDNYESLNVGDELKADTFAIGDRIDVTGISKGKGFAGVMKRYGFAGGPGGHGAHFHRAPGSVGQCATPSRVFKGLRLPGHMGCDTVTVKNLEVVRIDEEQNLILVKGAVPGGKNGIVRVRMA